MSLINDVLRQLDSKPNGNVEISSILPSTLITDNNENNESSKIQLIIAVVGISLLLIYISQLMLGRPLFSSQISSPQAIAPQMVTSQAIVSQRIAPQVISSKIVPAKVDPPELITTKKVAAETVTPEIVAVEIVAQQVTSPSVLSDQDAALLSGASSPVIDNVPADNKVDSIIQSSVVPMTKQGSDAVVISIQEESWEEKDYQTALRHFIGGNITESDRIIKRVLESSITSEYLGLQARIYIEKNNAIDFYELVKQHPDNNNIDWYKLVAPGLQLFSYYHLSNQYYYSLMKIEPEEIRWQLAVALNHIRLDEEDKALTIYNKLYHSKQTSNRQKQWLGNKIKRLSLHKA